MYYVRTVSMRWKPALRPPPVVVFISTPSVMYIMAPDSARSIWPGSRVMVTIWLSLPSILAATSKSIGCAGSDDEDDSDVVATEEEEEDCATSVDDGGGDVVEERQRARSSNLGAMMGTSILLRTPKELPRKDRVADRFGSTNNRSKPDGLVPKARRSVLIGIF